jgi:hypothetical protein
MDEHFRQKIFFGQKCPTCHGSKRKANAFCYTCYHKLPERLRQKLWRRFGDGFEAAFDEARTYLEEKIRREKRTPLFPERDSSD